MGLSMEEIISVLKIVASVLKLGNISFIPSNNIDGTEGCTISNDYGKVRSIVALTWLFVNVRSRNNKSGRNNYKLYIHMTVQKVKIEQPVFVQWT